MQNAIRNLGLGGGGGGGGGSNCILHSVFPVHPLDLWFNYYLLHEVAWFCAYTTDNCLSQWDSRSGFQNRTFFLCMEPMVNPYN